MNLPLFRVDTGRSPSPYWRVDTGRSPSPYWRVDTGRSPSPYWRVDTGRSTLVVPVTRGAPSPSVFRPNFCSLNILKHLTYFHRECFIFNRHSPSQVLPSVSRSITYGSVIFTASCNFNHYLSRNEKLFRNKVDICEDFVTKFAPFQIFRCQIIPAFISEHVVLYRLLQCCCVRFISSSVV
jgi:hypothetical protein